MNSQDSSNDSKSEYIKLLYEENGNHNRYLIDWRHKVLVRFFLSVASILFIAKWMWENTQTISHFWLFIPFTIIAILSIVFYMMDKRDREFMDLCIRVGSNLEQQMMCGEGFYGQCLKSHYKDNGNLKRPIFSFTTSFKIIYFGTAALSLFIAFKALFTISH